MEQYPLVKLDAETIVNVNHIVDADYTPEFDGLDEELGKHVHRKPKLVITTTAIESDAITNYDGDIKAGGSKSQTIVFHGDKAAIIWDWLAEHSYVIV